MEFVHDVDAYLLVSELTLKSQEYLPLNLK